MDTAVPREAAMVRKSFQAELDQLAMQVELMGVKVDQNLARMQEVMTSGSESIAEFAIRSDDEIDAMGVSLTERCYDILARENPVATDLRFVVSVLRILSEFERIGDLALRVVKLNEQRDQWVGSSGTYDILMSMVDMAVDCFRSALDAWSGQDLELATALAERGRNMDSYYEMLMARLLELRGSDAVAIATNTLIAGRSLERISDHAAIIGARLRYLLTGDPDHLSAEVR